MTTSKQSSHSAVRMLCEGGIMLAAAFVLSLLQFWKMYDGGGQLLKEWDGSKGNIRDLGNGAFTYDINVNHTDAKGVINLVQAAELTITSANAKVTVNGKDAQSGWVVAVGDVLNLSGATSITVNNSPVSAGDPGVVTDSNSTLVSYTVQAGDNAITIA